jgi:hypothetical protein
MSGGSLVQRVYVMDSQWGSQMVGMIQRYGSDEAGAVNNRLFGSASTDAFNDAWCACTPPLWKQREVHLTRHG